jgi:hypothetical protein
MRLHLPERWIDHLCNLPESGMGYQRVDIRLKNGDKLKGVFVFNAEEVECPLQSVYFKSEDITDIQLHRDST